MTESELGGNTTPLISVVKLNRGLVEVSGRNGWRADNSRRLMAGAVVLPNALGLKPKAAGPADVRPMIDKAACPVRYGAPRRLPFGRYCCHVTAHESAT